MQHIQESNLAWSLIAAAKAELNSRERNHVFVCIGSGDAFTAIRILLKLIAAKEIPLHRQLVQLCTAWLEGYVAHEDHERLQTIIAALALNASDFRPLGTARWQARSKNAANSAITRNVNHDYGVAAWAG